MLKSMIVILAIFGSVSAQAIGGNDYHGAVQDQKAVGAVFVGIFDAIQDQKAVGIQAGSKDVTKESQIETGKLLDLNEGF